MKRLFCYALILLCSSLYSLELAHADVEYPYFGLIGTEDYTYQYYHIVGGAICDVVNRNRHTHNVRLSAETTGGPRINIISIMTKDRQFGMSDIVTLREAYAGNITYGTLNSRGMISSVLKIDQHNATFIAGAEVDEEVVYVIVREIFQNFESFKSYHASLGGLTKEGMVRGLTPPIHPGAMRYFTENGYSIEPSDNGSSLLWQILPVVVRPQ